MDIPVKATQYTLSLLPETDSSWAITVEYRGRGLWAVKHGSLTLDIDGWWEFEPGGSKRDELYLSRHRFDLETAMRLAKAALPEIKVNGMTYRDVLAWNETHKRS